tara:strand:+ start:5133 stop:5414 length:282 start_codon:yes stop_codon:yes gene_type:complete
MTFKSDNIVPVTKEKSTRKLTNKEKTDAIAHHSCSSMRILDLDINDDNFNYKPFRVAKMYVEEIFEALDNSKIINIKKFENSFDYKGIILEKK